MPTVKPKKGNKNAPAPAPSSYKVLEHDPDNHVNTVIANGVKMRTVSAGHVFLGPPICNSNVRAFAELPPGIRHTNPGGHNDSTPDDRD